MKIGVIGVGNHASDFAGAICESDKENVLYAVCAEEYELASQFALAWNVEKVYSTYEELLKDKSIDFVFIASSEKMHYDHIMACLKYSKACLVDTPLGINSKEVSAVLYEAEAKSILVAEAIWNHALPEKYKIRDYLESGVIGTIRSINAQDCLVSDGKNLRGEIELFADVATIFGTNVYEIISDEEWIELRYFNGRKVRLNTKTNQNTEYYIRIDGEDGYALLEENDTKVTIGSYNMHDELIEEIHFNYPNNRYSSAIDIFTSNLKNRLIECPEMSHPESLRRINWIDHIRVKRGLLYSNENKEDLCCYQAEGIKKMIISPFRRYWLDCMNCIAYSLVGYRHEVPYIYYYNNRYTYGCTDEINGVSGRKYQSLAPRIPSIDIIKEITKNREKVYLAHEENPIERIKTAIDANKIIRVAVDLYDWIDSGYHFHTNHILHMSLIIGYDDTRKQLIVFDTGNYGFSEFYVDYDRAVVAMKGNENPSSFGEIDNDNIITMCSKEDFIHNAEVIVESINSMIQNREQVWDVKDFSEEELADCCEIIPTHMYSMQNRANMNAFFFEHAFSDDKIGEISLAEEFKRIGTKYLECKNKCLKIKLKKNRFEKLTEMKEVVFSLLEQERNLWLKCIESSQSLTMNNKFIEETAK